MKHYLFSDIETGEAFLVGANSKSEAKRIANSTFSPVIFESEVSEIEAEASGLDEY